MKHTHNLLEVKISEAIFHHIQGGPPLDGGANILDEFENLGGILEGCPEVRIDPACDITKRGTISFECILIPTHPVEGGMLPDGLGIEGTAQVDGDGALTDWTFETRPWAFEQVT